MIWFLICLKINEIYLHQYLYLDLYHIENQPIERNIKVWSNKINSQYDSPLLN